MCWAPAVTGRMHKPVRRLRLLITGGSGGKRSGSAAPDGSGTVDGFEFVRAGSPNGDEGHLFITASHYFFWFCAVADDCGIAAESLKIAAFASCIRQIGPPSYSGPSNFTKAGVPPPRIHVCVSGGLSPSRHITRCISSPLARVCRPVGDQLGDRGSQSPSIVAYHRRKLSLNIGKL